MQKKKGDNQEGNAYLSIVEDYTYLPGFGENAACWFRLANRGVIMMGNGCDYVSVTLASDANSRTESKMLSTE